ncbi:F-box domain-containing protein [Mycena venus]|uniref:F-box domain-containing protein n=1 Tax=Mycena venus TaxID=2733690 RepID=A0A8H6X4P0_9AGAR|nr:F-box domain-containing protein [Mycena venus]
MHSGAAADRARIAELEAQILDLERALATLRLQKTVVQERLDSYKYPILTMPNEIISEIFTHFLPTYPRCPPLTGLLSPTLLTHICHKWRDIALASPALWRSILVSEAIPFLIQRTRVLDILSRSGSCPLSIQIEGWEDETIHNPDLKGTLAAVLSHSARWEYLALRPAGIQLPDIQGSFPLLSELDIWLEYFGPPGATNTAFLELPQLCTVTLNDAAALHFVLPWVQITRLNLLRVYMHECLPVLRQTSNLVHCELQLYFDPDRRDDVLDLISLPCLESLTFNDPKPHESATQTCIHPLDVFITPALCNLDIPEKFLGRKPIESLTSFISKSGCALQDLRIIGKISVPRGSYRAAFPSIPRLCFEDSEDDSSS